MGNSAHVDGSLGDPRPRTGGPRAYLPATPPSRRPQGGQGVALGASLGDAGRLGRTGGQPVGPGATGGPGGVGSRVPSVSRPRSVMNEAEVPGRSP